MCGPGREQRSPTLAAAAAAKKAPSCYVAARFSFVRFVSSLVYLFDCFSLSIATAFCRARHSLRYSIFVFFFLIDPHRTFLIIGGNAPLFAALPAAVAALTRRLAGVAGAIISRGHSAGRGGLVMFDKARLCPL